MGSGTSGRALAVALAVLVSIAGCASVPSQLTASLDDGVAATASAGIAVQQLISGSALPPFTDTVLQDALTQLQDAVTATEQLEPQGADAGDRADALAALRSATDAVLLARQGVAAASGLPEALRALDAAKERLAGMGDELR